MYIPLIIALGAALAATIATFLLYAVPEGSDPTDKNVLLFMVPTSVLGLAAAGFFLHSLRRFKRGLRVAYALLTAGILLVPVSGTSLAISIYFNWFEQDFYQYVPYANVAGLTLAGLFTYGGMQRFANVLSVRHKLSNFFIGIPTALIVAAVVVLYLYYTEPLMRLDWFYGLAYGALAFFGACAFLAAIITARIKEMLGGAYNTGASWLLAAFVAMTLSVIHDLAVATYLPDSWASYLGYILWPYPATALLFMIAGYSFWRAVYGSHGSVASDATYIDSIVYVGGLASEPKRIDPYLDELRVITSRPGHNAAQLSDADKESLIGLYYRLEDYLLNKEPLRTYTTEEIRGHLTYDFQEVLRSHHKKAA